MTSEYNLETMSKRIKDDYERLTNDEQGFLSEIALQEENTVRYKAPVSTIRFYTAEEGDCKDNAPITLSSLCMASDKSGSYVQTVFGVYGATNEIASQDTQENGTRLYVGFCPEEDGIRHVLPVSDVAKLSLSGRTKVSFSGDISKSGLSPLALAKVYEDALKASGSKYVTIIEMYDKMQAMMSSRYTPTSHSELFKAVKRKAEEVLDSELQFSIGYISHRLSKCEWSAKKFSADDVSVRLSVRDSSTGYSGVAIAPVIAMGHKAVLLENSWYAKHMAISDEDIDEGVRAAVFDMEDNAKRLLDTRHIRISCPAGFAQNAVKALNRMAARQKNAKIPANLESKIVEEADMLSFSQLGEVYLWDIVQIFWSVPEMAGAQPGGVPSNYQESLGRTVSKILALNYGELDHTAK